MAVMIDVLKALAALVIVYVIIRWYIEVGPPKRGRRR